MLERYKKGMFVKQYYQRGISLHKQSINGLLRVKIERNMPVNQEIKDAFANLRVDINSDNLDKLLELNFFKDDCNMLFTDTSRTKAYMRNRYIKDVLSMLALIFAEQEKKI